MDSIYSRKRINIPKIKGFYTKNNNKNKKILTVFVIVCVGVLTFYNILKSILAAFFFFCFFSDSYQKKNYINDPYSIFIGQCCYILI